MPKGFRRKSRNKVQTIRVFSFLHVVLVAAKLAKTREMQKGKLAFLLHFRVLSYFDVVKVTENKRNENLFKLF